MDALMNGRYTFGAFLTLLLAFPPPTAAQLTPDQALVEMGRGINLGNTLEPPREGAWNNGPAQEYYFDDYRAAGFSTVRIPVRWDEHTAGSAPFAVQASWMDRVEQVVDWGLARDLIIIINGHHEDWLKQNYANADVRARYDSIWSQIATRFRNKSDRLLFEIINEPFGMTRSEVDDLNARILGIIRRSNPTRIVIYSGNEWSGADQMMAAAIPNDDYLMAYYHSYDPWSFAGEGQGTWGTDSDRATLASRFRQVADWSAATSIPVMISEFGAVRQTDFNSRMAHYAAYVEGALSNNIAFQVWDDGGNFGIYQRGARGWNDVKDILVKAYPDGPTKIQAGVESDSVVTLSWESRASHFSAIRVERRSGESALFEEVARVEPSSTQYADSTVSGGLTYYYRVVAESGLLEDRYSYPVRISVSPWIRSSFHGAPARIPGLIQAEDFDIGGEGLTYHDTDGVNIPGAYRPNEGVDIEARSDGGYHVAYVEDGEWLEYTVRVDEGGDYMVTAHVASVDGGGQFRFEFGTQWTRALVAPRTGDWETLAAVSKTMRLEAGEQVMRVRIFSGPPFNLDSFLIEKASVAGVPPQPTEPTLAVYPNPFRNEFSVQYVGSGTRDVNIELYDLLGQRLRRFDMSSRSLRVSLQGLPSGAYVLRILEGGRPVAQRLLVSR